MPGAALKTDLLRWSRRRDPRRRSLRGLGVGRGPERDRRRGRLRRHDRLARPGRPGSHAPRSARWCGSPSCASCCPRRVPRGVTGTITTAAVELIADARVPGCDDELVAMEPEFLDRARRGDHTSLQVLTQHFKACARADGSKPAPPDEFTIAEVGDRGASARFDVAEAGGARPSATRSTRSPGPPPPNDQTTLAQRQAEGFVRMCEVALARGIDADGARPVVSYLTHARTADDVTHPLTLGLFAGVIDPRGTGPDPLRRHHRARRAPTRDGEPVERRAGHPGVAPPPSAGPSPPATRTADGPAVRSPPPGATSTTSSPGKTAATPPAPTTAPPLSTTPHVPPRHTPTGPPPSTTNTSACSDPTAPKSTPTPGTANLGLRPS